MTQPFVLRVAVAADIEALRALIALSIDTLLAGLLPPEQVAASHRFMALDSQLIEDGTYFVVEQAGDPAAGLVGCGGWSRRATVYGGDRTAGRDPRLLDPATEPARIRAMYAHPAFTRRGIARMVLDAGEAAARAEGFSRVVLNATVAGVPLYSARGYVAVERFEDGGIPIVRMEKACLPSIDDIEPRHCECASTRSLLKPMIERAIARVPAEAASARVCGRDQQTPGRSPRRSGAQVASGGQQPRPAGAFHPRRVPAAAMQAMRAGPGAARWHLRAKPGRGLSVLRAPEPLPAGTGA